MVLAVGAMASLDFIGKKEWLISQEKNRQH
jgi:hypothetical protein